MSRVSYALAFFLGAFLQCILYGVFVCLFIVACYVQWDKFRRGRGLNLVMALAIVFFGFTLTTSCVLYLARAVHVIIYLPSGVTISQFLAPPYPTMEVARWGVFQFQIVVADAIMVYRMYHIYNRKAIVCVIPLITITGLFAVGCGLTNQLRYVATPSGLRTRDKWSAACYCLTLFNSIFTTTAISLRLWFVHRETAVVGVQTNGSVILRAMKVLIESAALWTTFVASTFFCFLAKSNLRYTFLAMTGPVVGISFCLIIVRLGSPLPNVKDEYWHVSFHIPPSKAATSDQTAVSLTQFKVQRNEYAGESRESPMEIPVSQKQTHMGASDDLRKAFQPSPWVHTSAQ